MKKYFKTKVAAVDIFGRRVEPDWRFMSDKLPVNGIYYLEEEFALTGNYLISSQHLVEIDEIEYMEG